ncbi:DEAD/DEAH box helicase [Clostridium sp. JNZ J1-5]
MNNSSFINFNLSEEILKALHMLEYEKPSQVQEKVIPIAIEDKDIIVKSQTGSGKTAAFAIPICEKIKIEKREPQALILTPTRELAIQIKEDVSNIGRLKRIRCAAVFGKHPMDIQVRELKQRVHVVVGTPGRTLDHIEKGNVNFQDIKYLIIDEADKMLNMGFIEQVEAVINKLPKNRITMLFSATISDEIESLCNKYMNSPNRIEINSQNITNEKIEEVCYDAEVNKKFSLLNRIICTELPESCIIFCNTKEEVDKVFQKMVSRDYSCSKLHGGMEQKDRIDTMERFKKGEFQFLVATDVAARGIHIEDITHVINYDVPTEKESYVHRIGRTGRAGKIGKALTFVYPYEIKFLNIIEEYLEYRITKKEIPSEEEVERGKRILKEKAKLKPKEKLDKSASLNKQITKLYINAGKKKKIRAGDIVGAITNIKGVSPEDIGIIDVQDGFSYVDILDGKGKIVLEALKDTTIKGKKVRVERAEK